MSKRVYLDNAATTMVDPAVVKALLPYHSEKYGNPSSLHAFGREAARALEESRATLAKVLNCEAGEIVFTSGGTESDNLALLGVAALAKTKRVITTAIEHPAVLKTCDYLEANGFEVVRLPVDRYGIIRMADLERALSKEAAAVSVMHANNEVGSVQPIDAVAKLCASKGVPLHVDAVQSFGKLPIELSKAPISLLSVSSHKIHGPKGAGALFVRRGVKLSPRLLGGGHERGLRSGTENVSGIVGFAKAAEIARRNRVKNCRKMSLLRDRLAKRVLAANKGAWLNGPTGVKRLCNNANFSFPGIEGEALVLRLDAEGIAASTGSACSSKSLKPSHVLLAMGLTPVQAHGSLRLTLSRFTTAREIDYAAGKIAQVVKELGGFSNVSREEAMRRV
ncbi:cysteine desulfurase NifS [Candidatus Micrarchaeota archaeon CG1_02_60_51]|nr:MAG: cysteine desulfurase NifS [Candidatus Micrarchaeota archaeon CG1_02_60_51]